MKLCFLNLFLVFISVSSNAQSLGGPPKHIYKHAVSTFYFEAGGNATFASINYDLTLGNDYGIRIGASPGLFLVDHENDDSGSDYNFDFVGLIGGYKLHGISSHKLETGIGIVFGETITPRDDNYPSVPALTLNIGYRFVTNKYRGLSFRGMFTPSISESGILPWFGASIGISFQNKNK